MEHTLLHRHLRLSGKEAFVGLGVLSVAHSCLLSPFQLFRDIHPQHLQGHPTAADMAV